MPERRTKIIATIGPAQDPPGALERLLDTGVDVLRVNLSHASPRAQAERVRRARAHRPDIAVLVDLAGPKLRLGELPADQVVSEGETLTLGAGGVPVGDPSLYDRVRPGDPIFIADGTIDLEAQRGRCRPGRLLRAGRAGRCARGRGSTCRATPRRCRR